jgi:hypothetical protein
VIPSNVEPSMSSTFCGTSIDLSDENENADDSIRFNREVDSNEIVKIIYAMRNMMIQELQYAMKFQYLMMVKSVNQPMINQINENTLPQLTRRLM